MSMRLVLLRRWTIIFVAVFSLAGCVAMSLQDEVAGLMKQGQHLYAEKQYDAALDKFVDVILKDPQHWQAYVWAARVLVVKGNWSEAVAKARKAFEMSPQGGEVVPVLAEALLGGGLDALKSGRFAESIGYFLDYLRLEPGNAKAWLGMGKAYLGQQQFGDALNAFIQGLAKVGPAEQRELLNGIMDGGVQALKSGKYKDAIGAFKEYLKHDGKSLEAYTNLAQAYLESGDLVSTLQAFQKALRIDPSNPEALKFLQRY